ncbi:MAG: Foldase protein PrsA 3 precursor [Firmicutes bacterium ADurb.Bin419]|nr:MAG: Foldase protein PrsA 3 precursor [Firmicutes bacterium ADurb.Bin419]
MKKKILLAVAIVVVVAAAVLIPTFLKKGGTGSNNTDETIDETKQFGFEALKINGTYVSTDVFSEEYNNFYQKYKNDARMLQTDNEERNDIFLEELIETLVMDDYFFNKSGVTVSDEEVESYVSKYVTPRYADEDEQTTYFEAMGFLNEEDMKNNIRDYLIKQQIYFEAAKKAGLTLTDEEREEAYTEHKTFNKKLQIRNILIAINDKRTKEQAQELANTVYTKLKNGESFETLAKQYSDDSESKDNGGLKKNVLPGFSETDFDDAVFTAEVGQLLEPIYLAKGFEMVKVEKSTDFSHPEDEFSETVLVEKFLNSEKYDEWYEEIKKGYQIEITDPAFNAYKALKAEKYDEAAKFYEAAYAKTDDLGYMYRACETYVLGENWAELIRASKIGYKAESDNVLYYIFEAKGEYKSGNKDEGLKKMQAAQKMAKNDVYFLGVIKNTYEELGLKDEAAKINVN